MGFPGDVGGLVREQGLDSGGEWFDPHDAGENRAVADRVFDEERGALIDLKSMDHEETTSR